MADDEGARKVQVNLCTKIEDIENWGMKKGRKRLKNRQYNLIGNRVPWVCAHPIGRDYAK